MLIFLGAGSVWYGSLLLHPVLWVSASCVQRAMTRRSSGVVLPTSQTRNVQIHPALRVEAVDGKAAINPADPRSKGSGKNLTYKEEAYDETDVKYRQTCQATLLTYASP